MSAPSTPSSNRRARVSAGRETLDRRRSGTPGVAWETPPSATRKIQHVAARLPQCMSLHHAHPTAILERLLDDICDPASRHYARYGHFVTGEGEKLVQLLHRCVRKEVWDLLTQHQAQIHPSIADLASLGGDTSYYGRAIYLHILHFPRSTTRLYVGQAFNLAARIRNQHFDFRYRRDHPSLHNYAMDRSTEDVYVVLANVREACERSDLVLNLLEMWMVLWVGTLPDSVMEVWLGERDAEAGGGKVYGLNVAEPLDQGDDASAKAAFGLLRDAGDEMARDYFWDVRKRSRPVLKDVVPVIKEGVVGRAWMGYMPHVLGVLMVGFVVGRWTARWRWRR